MDEDYGNTKLFVNVIPYDQKGFFDKYERNGLVNVYIKEGDTISNVKQKVKDAITNYRQSNEASEQSLKEQPKAEITNTRTDNNLKNTNNGSNNEETRLDNTRPMESSTLNSLVGELDTREALFRTIQANNKAGSIGPNGTIEDIEELESRGINPYWDKALFRNLLEKEAKYFKRYKTY